MYEYVYEYGSTLHPPFGEAVLTRFDKLRDFVSRLRAALASSDKPTKCFQPFNPGSNPSARSLVRSVFCRRFLARASPCTNAETFRASP